MEKDWGILTTGMFVKIVGEQFYRIFIADTLMAVNSCVGGGGLGRELFMEQYRYKFEEIWDEPKPSCSYIGCSFERLFDEDARLAKRFSRKLFPIEPPRFRKVI